MAARALRRCIAALPLYSQKRVPRGRVRERLRPACGANSSSALVNGAAQASKQHGMRRGGGGFGCPGSLLQTPPPRYHANIFRCEGQRRSNATGARHRSRPVPRRAPELQRSRVAAGRAALWTSTHATRRPVRRGVLSKRGDLEIRGPLRGAVPFQSRITAALRDGTGMHRRDWTRPAAALVQIRATPRPDHRRSRCAADPGAGPESPQQRIDELHARRLSAARENPGRTILFLRRTYDHRGLSLLRRRDANHGRHVPGRYGRRACRVAGLSEPARAPRTR